MRTIRTALSAFVRVLLDTIAAILGLYYSRKYAETARRLGLSLVEPSTQRGFIVIQIDGLSYVHLTTAMTQGRLPYLQRMLQRDGCALHPWHSGIPCTTPAAQAGIMYGNNDDIPAYRWYDKASGESVVCSHPGAIHALQDRISDRQRGILVGGSSYMNMFDGDATLSLFTLGAMNRKRFFESVRGLGFFLLFILNPFRTLKMLILSLWEYVTDRVQYFTAVVKQRPARPGKGSFAFLRVVSNVILREIQTFAVMVDIYRGVPAIYTTYLGYDALAHQYGPLSTPALRSLDAVDARIRQIDSFRRFMAPRPYDLFILSDHGMTPSVPFKKTYGQTLGEVVRDLIGDSVRLSEVLEEDRDSVLQAMYLGNELDAIEANVRPPLAYIPRAIREMVMERVRMGEALGDGAVDSDHTDLVVRSSGSLSHIYFGAHPEQMDLSQVMTRYPTLVDDLVSYNGIWLVVGRQNGQVTIISREGAVSVGEDITVEGVNPLDLLPDAGLAAEQIRRLALFPTSGDLILFGYYDPQRDLVCCFEEQWGSHGGIGGAQETAFMLMEKQVDWTLEGVSQATEIYDLFISRYR